MTREPCIHFPAQCFGCRELDALDAARAAKGLPPYEPPTPRRRAEDHGGPPRDFAIGAALALPDYRTDTGAECAEVE